MNIEPIKPGKNNKLISRTIMFFSLCDRDRIFFITFRLIINYSKNYTICIMYFFLYSTPYKRYLTQYDTSRAILLNVYENNFFLNPIPN